MRLSRARAADMDQMSAPLVSHAFEKSRRRINRALSVAGLSGWTMAFFGTLSLLTGWGSISSLLIGALLVLCAFNELRGRTLLRKLDLAAPARLSRNQIFIALGVCGYCLMSALATTHMDPDLHAALAQAGMGSSADHIFELAARVTKAVYFFVIAITLVVQMLTAWFYSSRDRDVRRLAAV